jgi:hypothetical protein
VATGGDGGPRRAAESTSQDSAVAPTQLGTNAGSQRTAQRTAQHRIPCQTASQQWRWRSKRRHQQQEWYNFAHNDMLPMINTACQVRKTKMNER